MSELTEKARALADAATPGPWTNWEGQVYPRDPMGTATIVNMQQRAASTLPEGLLWPLPNGEHADAAFIAEARTLVPALCDEIDAWEAEGRELRSDHTALRALTAAQAARIRELEAFIQPMATAVVTVVTGKEAAAVFFVDPALWGSGGVTGHEEGT